MSNRQDLATAFQWAYRLNYHEAVANHFSLAINPSGTRFLMNANQMHFSLVTPDNLIELDADDSTTLEQESAPDPTAWGLHGSIHRNCSHARCVMHVHPIYSTVLASLANSELLPIDQNCAMFYGRTVIDENYGGLALESEGERISALLTDPWKCVAILGNHGIVVIGSTVAQTFTRLYYFERAAETYIKALQTNRELRIIPHEIAEKTARQLDGYPEQDEKFLTQLKQML